MRWTTLVGLFLVSGAIAVGQPMQSRVVDPFFLIEYDPTTVHFESLPVFVNKRCPVMRERYSRAWVYSRVKTADTEYFIVYGRTRVPSQGHQVHLSDELEEDDGIIIAIQGSQCLVDQWQFAFRKEVNRARKATPINAPDNVLNALAADLLKRYERAFGSKKSFLRQVTPEGRKELPSAVLRQLESFERDAP
jgi:hypothetical protein